MDVCEKYDQVEKSLVYKRLHIFLLDAQSEENDVSFSLTSSQYEAPTLSLKILALCTW